MTLDDFNKLQTPAAATELLKCCGSLKWVSLMMEHFPFVSLNDVLSKATNIWNNECTKEDLLAAFAHHPKIGDIKSMEEKFATTKVWAAAEQSGVQATNETVMEGMAKGNQEYEEKFGFIFIVCATGKSGQEMLQLLQKRLLNSYDEELNIARNEQNKITQLRLQKLLL